MVASNVPFWKKLDEGETRTEKEVRASMRRAKDMNCERRFGWSMSEEEGSRCCWRKKAVLIIWCWSTNGELS